MFEGVGESSSAGGAGTEFRTSSACATATAWSNGILGLPNNGIRRVNRDVVGPVIDAVVTSPTPPTPTGMGFCGGTGIDRAGKGLGCGTKSSMDEMEIVGLRMPRWLGLDNTPCTFWGTARGGGVGDHDGGGTPSSDVWFGGSTEAPSPGGGAG